MLSHIHGPDCMCGMDDNPSAQTAQMFPGAPRARRVLAEGSQAAPSPAFLSPFAPAQESSTRNVLAQIHPDVGITRGALTLILRMQDALAHYLLHRAYAGANPPHRPSRALDGSRTPAQIEHDEKFEEELAAQVADPTHCLHFLFPSGLEIPELSRHANSERSKAVVKFLTTGSATGPPDHADQFQAHPPADDHFQFGFEISRRWFSDFQTGVEQGPGGEEARAAARRAQKAKEAAEEKKNKGRRPKPKVAESKDEAGSSSSTAASAASTGAGAGAGAAAESKEEDAKKKSKDAASKPLSLVLLPEVLQQPIAQVSMCAMVEYLSAEVLELSGNRTLDQHPHGGAPANITPLDVWQSVMADEELRELVRFINICWSTRGMDELESPAHAAAIPPHAPAESFGLPSIEFMLSEEFALAKQAQAVVTESSWYKNPAKVKQYAVAFARGEMKLAPVEKALMDLCVRPLRFYGCDLNPLLGSQPPFQDDAPPGGGDNATSFVSIGVTDGADREWRFMLELAPRTFLGCVRELCYGGGAIGYIARAVSREGVDTMRVDLAACHLIGDDQGHVYKTRANDMSLMEAELLEQIKALKDKLDKHREAKEVVTKQKQDEGIQRAKAATEGSSVQMCVEALVDTVSVAAERDAAESGASSSTEEEKQGESASSTAASSSSSSSAAAAEESFDPFAVFTAPAAAAAASSSSKSAASSKSSAASASSKAFDALASAFPAAAGKLTAAQRAAVIAAIPASSPATAAALAKMVANRSKPPVLSLGSNSRLTSLSGLLGGIGSHITNSQVQSELEATIARVIHLVCWSRYGPTLYRDNHPEAAKRAFTIALLDEAMSLPVAAAAPAAASAEAQPASPSSLEEPALLPALPQLPIVLLDLIAQFHSFDLPYIPSEAAAQLKATGWLPQPAARAAYPGQLNNPVEKLGQKASDLDEILEPAEFDEGHEDDGEDEEDEDEEGEPDYEDEDSSD